MIQTDREVSHRQQPISQWTLWKLCEFARKVPQQIGATHYPFRQPDSGFQNRNISLSFHFLGKVCDLDGRHMTDSEWKYLTPSCSLLRIREISRTLHTIPLMRWCRYRQTNDYDMRNLDGGKGGKQRSRMQGCKDARMQRQSFLHSCTVEWKATTKGKNLFRVYAVFYSTLLFQGNGVYW